ncbi:hypothetical protein BC829DRAFT_233590 [Chytridium lagenaria]|nr:hypothetical protein BC829DRAFT_233590 [Chytridium lagenaria]
MSTPQPQPSTSICNFITSLAFSLASITVVLVILAEFYPSNLSNRGKGGPCEANIVTFLLGCLSISVLYGLPTKSLEFYLDRRPEWKNHLVGKLQPFSRIVSLFALWVLLSRFALTSGGEFDGACWALPGCLLI